LHAKVYVIDTTAALVTSANATLSGMEANLEFGVAVCDPQLVQAVANEVLGGFGGNAKPETYEPAEISALERLVGRVKARLPRPVDVGRLAEEERAIIELESTEELLEAFTGWRRLTLAGVIAQPADEFQLEDVYSECVPRAAKEYPENRHPQAKLRQQLQSLRDLGLIEFLGAGRYEKNFDARAYRGQA
jgi:type II restriction enzyme